MEDLCGRGHKNEVIQVAAAGVADGQDEYRQDWIKDTIVGMQKAMGEGVELIGYLHWSLLDNFEWAYGKWPRFGLVEIDYKTGKRMPSQDALNRNLQLSLYSLGLQNRWPHLKPEDIKLSLYFLKHGEKLTAKPAPDATEKIKIGSER